MWLANLHRSASLSHRRSTCTRQIRSFQRLLPDGKRSRRAHLRYSMDFSTAFMTFFCNITTQCMLGAMRCCLTLHYRNCKVANLMSPLRHCFARLCTAPHVASVHEAYASYRTCAPPAHESNSVPATVCCLGQERGAANPGGRGCSHKV